jgi:AcrR family transcriptional regulator
MQRGSETREAILTSAANLFAGVGYSSVSMRDIAKGAGITPGALYNHFRDKSDLYAATMEHALGDRMSGMSESLEADAPLEQRFRELVSASVTLFSTDENFARLLHRELLDGDDARLEFVTKSVLQGPFGQIVDMMAEFDTGRDPELLASLVTCSIIGHFEFHRVRRNYTGYNPDQDDPGLVAKNVSDFLLSGILAMKENG